MQPLNHVLRHNLNISAQWIQSLQRTCTPSHRFSYSMSPTGVDVAELFREGTNDLCRDMQEEDGTNEGEWKDEDDEGVSVSTVRHVSNPLRKFGSSRTLGGLASRRCKVSAWCSTNRLHQQREMSLALTLARHPQHVGYDPTKISPPSGRILGQAHRIWAPGGLATEDEPLRVAGREESESD